MNFMTLLLLAIGLAVVYYMYRSSQTTGTVETEHQVPIPEDGLQAIEYFWRPG